VGAVTLVEIRLWWGVDSSGRRTVMAVLDQYRGWSARWCDLFVWIGSWALGLGYTFESLLAFLFIFKFYFIFVFQ
jgi:hypothetical protein